MQLRGILIRYVFFIGRFMVLNRVRGCGSPISSNISSRRGSLHARQTPQSFGGLPLLDTLFLQSMLMICQLEKERREREEKKIGFDVTLSCTR